MWVIFVRAFKVGTKSGNMDQERNFFGRSQDDQNNITGGMGSESVEKYSLGAFVLSVDAQIMQVGRQNDTSFGSKDQTFTYIVTYMFIQTHI